MSNDPYRNVLPPEVYRVMRQKGTEAPGTGEYLHEHGSGVYRCRACGAALFSSDAKFDSGTGWPSFDAALPGQVRYIHDDSDEMSRTEVVCASCGSHLGHVFSDGPTHTTGKRYCMNSVCLELERESTAQDGSA
jgi:peptide-methionine (R)-S-oxide reductase